MYTIGQFAKKTGLTIRALRYYDEKGLLKPASLSEGGQRLYNDENIVGAQKIATYKYLDFSIEEIKALLKEEGSLLTSLQQQKLMLEQKKKQLEMVISSLDTAITIQEKLTVTEPTLLLLVMHSLLTEQEQKKYLSQYLGESIIDEIYQLLENNLVEINRQYIEISYELKQAYKMQGIDEEVKQLLESFINIIPKEIQLKVAEAFAGVELEQVDSWLFPSPFTLEEEAWLGEQIERLNILGDDFYEAANK